MSFERRSRRYCSSARRSSSGARGQASWSFTSDRREDLTTIVGALGTLRFSTYGDAPLELETAAGTELFALANPRTIQGPMIQAVVDSLRGRGPSPSTGVSAARTSEVMDRALASYYGSRAEGFWKQPERWPGRRV